MHLKIRSKLVLFTVLPVIAVYSILFWLGVSHVREHLRIEAQNWLVEHARHQASRLALVFSEVPALAESLGDVILANPDQPQSLLYAHLIDGLRRTPIAETAAVAFGSPERGAMMRRGAASGQELPPTAPPAGARLPGWQDTGDTLRFNRPVYRQGRKIGDTWVEFALRDVYTEMERLRSTGITLLLSRDDGGVLLPADTGGVVASLAPLIARDSRTDEVLTVGDDGDGGSGYWMVSATLPGAPWRVTAVTPTELALAPARREASMVVLALLLSLFTIMLIIGAVARRITRPLATLDKSVQQIAQGNFEVAPETISDDELGRLASAIRRMAGHIADRENQLRSSHQRLEQRVAARTSALQNSNALLVRQMEETRRTEEALRLAKEQAQQASRAKSEFLSNMSHELRTPLHGVLGYTQILRRDRATSTSQRDSLDAIERCGQHLLTLINDILDLTKIEAGQMQVDIQPTGLRQLLEDVQKIIGQRAHNKGLQLDLELAPGLPDGINTDAVKLKQILLNLLGNAVKFTARGAVALRVGPAPDGRLDFEVVDTGVGIPADKIGGIFDAFHQVRDGHAIDGTGLGLAINRRLIGLLGGEDFGVESTPGSGSRFHFRLPYQPVALEVRNEPAAAGQMHKRQLAPGANCSVMVVDRFPENRDVLASLLQYARCDVESFPEPAAATARLHEKAFDLIIIDVRLPDSRAEETVSELRRHAVFGSPRLIAVSGNVFAGTDLLAARAGYDAFLAKPFNDAELFDLIEDLLDIRFETLPAVEQLPLDLNSVRWPDELARDTAQRIQAATALGDAGSLFQLAEELAENPSAPRADVENMALMAKLFDFDGLRSLSERLQNTA